MVTDVVAGWLAVVDDLRQVVNDRQGTDEPLGAQLMEDWMRVPAT